MCGRKKVPMEVDDRDDGTQKILEGVVRSWIRKNTIIKCPCKLLVD